MIEDGIISKKEFGELLPMFILLGFFSGFSLPLLIVPVPLVISWSYFISIVGSLMSASLFIIVGRKVVYS